MFVLFIYHFWARNRQILNFEHFELVLACFYSVKRAFSTKWWPGEENAPKIIFFAFLVSFHINTTYIKLDWNSDNFLIFWCTLIQSSLKSLKKRKAAAWRELLGEEVVDRVGREGRKLWIPLVDVIAGFLLIAAWFIFVRHLSYFSIFQQPFSQK